MEQTINRYLENHSSITIRRAHELARRTRPDIPRATVRWRLYEMTRRGALRRVRRGVYTSAKKPDFTVIVPDRLVSIYDTIRGQLPFVDICVWHTEVINQLAQHQTAPTVDIVDVEREAVSAVRDVLTGAGVRATDYGHLPVIQGSLLQKERLAVVKRLITESPLSSYRGTVVPRIEKILVDLICDENLFFYLQGAEMYTIYSSVLDRYSVRYDTLSRYASRRGVREEVKRLLAQITGKMD